MLVFKVFSCYPTAQIMNLREIDESINDIKRALGFKVQSVSFYDKTLVLKLWQNHVSYFLVLSAQMGRQGVFLLDDLQSRKKIKNEKKPLQLFTSTHFKDSYLVEISRDQRVGRKVDLEFSSAESEELQISVNLIPSALNISVVQGQKSVHLQKPRDLPAMGEVDVQTLSTRGLENLKQPWHQELNIKVFNPAKDQVAKQPVKSGLQIEIGKKAKAIEKVKKDLQAKSKTDFFEFASLLEADPLQAKIRFPEFYDESVNRHKLKDLYFAKHKALAGKKDRVIQRVKELTEELQALEKISEADWERRQSKNQLRKINFKEEVKVRKFELAHDLVAYLGKSAQDNLKLLRSAKAWHLWCHVKDLPSAHMIIFKDKNREVTEAEQQKALKWFTSEIKNNTKGSHHAALDILIAECRYVKPIKGDKLGRVNYSHEKVVRIKEEC